MTEINCIDESPNEEQQQASTIQGNESLLNMQNMGHFEVNSLRNDNSSDILDFSSKQNSELGRMEMRRYQTTLLQDLFAKVMITYVKNIEYFIHLGKGIYLPRSKYNDACNQNSTSLFLKMLCDMILTVEELKTSTVSGKDSNRKRGNSRHPNKLDPTRVLAIKDITRRWLLEQCNYSEEVVDEEVCRVVSHISNKIADLQKEPKKKKRKLIATRGVDEDENLFQSDRLSLEELTPEEQMEIMRAEIVQLNETTETLQNNNSFNKTHSSRNWEDEDDTRTYDCPEVEGDFLARIGNGN